MARRHRVLLLLACLWWLPAGSVCGQGYGTNARAQEAEASQQTDVLNQKLASPRDTLRTFFEAVDGGNTKLAAKCLDLSAYNSISASATGPRRAERLKWVIDRMRRVRYDEIPGDHDTISPYHLGAVLAQEMSDTNALDADRISMERGEDELWRFSQGTVDAIDDIYPRWKDLPPVEGLSLSLSHMPFDDWFGDLFPEYLHHTHFILPTYKWIYLLGLIFVGFLADLLVRMLLSYSTSAWFRYRKAEKEKKIERKLWKPIGLLVQALVWYGGTSLVDLPDVAMTILLVGLKIFTVIAGMWTGFLLINLLSTFIARKAELTDSKFDDLLVPMISRSLKIFVVVVGVLTCAQAFSLPMAGLLGGTAIGGMALALASQDAVSNLFGSITVLVDRPFEIGDWVITNGVEGTVETVGFRSTRIRTFYNSMITVPNSKLTTAVVDNMGRRRYRRIKEALGVQYDTTPAQIEAFCEGIRELLRRHPYTRKDYFHVYFNGYGDSSLNILLYCFVECPDWSIELREKHRLFIDILKLAEQLGVSFAFPTQTLHMFQEEHSTNGACPELSEPIRDGERIAASIAGPLLTAGTRPGPVEFRRPSNVENAD